MFRDLTPSPSSGRAGGLVAPKFSFGATNLHILTLLSAREIFIDNFRCLRDVVWVLLHN
jgi:hypothetical protein